MHWWFSGLAGDNTAVVRHTVFFRSRIQSRGPVIAAQLPRLFPLEFARATNGYIYMASGVSSVIKWDGLSHQVKTAGVEAPETAVTLEATGSGTITGSYQAYLRYVDEDGNVSNLSPVSETVVASDVGKIVYTDVETPSQDKVLRRQILRNTAGQFLTFYVDVDTTDTFSTTFESTLTDADLRNQTAQPLFDPSLATQLANRFGVPPADKPLIAYYQNRLWLYGDIEYAVGNIQVTNGSATVTGIGTEWMDGLAGRFLYVNGSDVEYEIESVDEEAQTITLTAEYKGTTNKFALYSIQSDIIVRNQLAFSEPGQFDAWPAAQTMEVASSDDIDDIPTALISTQSFLYICQRRHTYRLSFLHDPFVDGGIFLSARRGVINNRCWQNVDGFVYMMDDRGVYRFDGSDQVEEVSLPVQDLFYFDKEPGGIRINWEAARFFHSSHDRNDSTIRWFVALSGQRLPRHALCFNYVSPQFWLEEYPWPIGDSCLLKTVNPVPVGAGKGGDTFAFGVGTLDQVLARDGDTRGNVVSAGLRTVVVDSSLTLPGSANLVGAMVSIVSGRGKGQSQRIASVSGQTITVLRPWATRPDSTSVFQLGAVSWRWKSHWARWLIDETTNTRRVTAGFKPNAHASTMDMRVYRDYSETPLEWSIDWPVGASDGSGITTKAGDPDAVIDLTQDRGFSYLTLDGFKEYNRWRKDLVAIELGGFSSEDRSVIYEVNLEGAR